MQCNVSQLKINWWVVRTWLARLNICRPTVCTQAATNMILSLPASNSNKLRHETQTWSLELRIKPWWNGLWKIRLVKNGNEKEKKGKWKQVKRLLWAAACASGLSSSALICLANKDLKISSPEPNRGLRTRIQTKVSTGRSYTESYK